MERDKIPQSKWDLTMNEIRLELDRRRLQKGDGAFISLHEAWGKIGEEYREFQDAVHAKDALSARGELLDIVVSGIVALASLGLEVERPCGSCGKVGHTADDHSEVIS